MKTIVIFTIPAVGHTNPILASVNEFIKNNNNDSKIVIYSNYKFKSKIESLGAEYRAYTNRDDEVKELVIDKNTSISTVIGSLFEIIYGLIDNYILRIVKELENDKPDLILCDAAALYSNWFIRLYKLNHGKLLKEEAYPFPKVGIYTTTFCNLENVYPTDAEKALTKQMDKIKIGFLYIKYEFQFRKLARKYKIDYINPLKEFIYSDPTLPNIVFVCPELHPSANLYPKNIRFVGASIDNDAHVDNYFNHKINTNIDILDAFESKNPVLTVDEIFKNYQKKLIYVSLGSVLQNNIEFYKNIIKAIETFDDEPLTKREYRVKRDDIHLLISVGDICFDKLKDNLPKNIHIAPSVPQIEVLKRASLFITHNGMNSTSESVHYGVPMICIPITTDQPNVAKRVANDLKLGVILNIDNLTYLDVRSSIHEILESPKYYEQSIKYASYSNKSIGKIEASKYIKELLN